MTTFPKIIPIFPLNGVIYFPKTNLPLNIFEQRYLDLVNDTFKKDKFMGIKVDYELGPIGPEAVWQGVLEEGAVWCYPKEFSFKHAIRKFYNNPGVYIKRSKELSKYIKENKVNVICEL